MNLLKLFLLNYKLFSFKGLYYNFIIDGIRNNNSLIVFQGKISFYKKSTSKISINNGSLFINKSFRAKEPLSAFLEIGHNAEINVENTMSIHSGCHIIILDNAKLNLGSGYINRNVKIRCFMEISIGMDVAISENVTIWDSDAHEIVGGETDITQPVIIGNHVWIGNNVTILKGVTIGDGSVIAAGSLVNKSIPSGCLAAGVPAKVIKENVKWN